jgi:hypothetical protein
MRWQVSLMQETYEQSDLDARDENPETEGSGSSFLSSIPT